VYGGRRTRKRRKRKGGFFFLGNTSNLLECENDCSNDCSKSCPILCDNAVSKLSIHKDSNARLKEAIEDKKTLINIIYYNMGSSERV